MSQSLQNCFNYTGHLPSKMFKIKIWCIKLFGVLIIFSLAVFVYWNYTNSLFVSLKSIPIVSSSSHLVTNYEPRYDESNKSSSPKYKSSENNSFNSYENEQFGTRYWRTYYPEISSYLSAIESGSIQWPVPVPQTTSAKFSNVQIQPAGSVKEAKIGDLLRAVIQTKNGLDHDKTHGGDYFHVRLIGVDKDGKPNEKNALSPDVQDFGNGTYSFIAPLLWEGETRLIVELVHPSEAVAMLITKTNGFVGRGVLFTGTYLNGDKQLCNVGLAIRDPLNPPCNFSRPNKGITWFCDRPRDNKCTALKWIAASNTQEESFLLGNQPLFTTNVNWKAEINGSGLTFKVAKSNFATNMFDKLPPCNRLSGVSEYANDPRWGKNVGLHLDGRWRSLQCNNVDTHKLERANKCFKNKIMYLIGDSTLRQWFLGLTKILRLKENDNGDETVWQRPRHSRSESLNFTVHYFGHGSPLHGLGPPSSRPYVVDTLSDIKPTDNGKHLYIVINLALHFSLFDTVVYIKRLDSIRDSIKDLLQVSPEATVMIRGCIRYKMTKIPVPSEWLSFRLCKILRKTFRQLPNVGFLDTWPITGAHPSWDTHPDDTSVAQHVALFMSYVCQV